MPKLSEAGTTRKISIYEIVETGNVRADYADIEELAASIRKNSLLEPILVKPGVLDPLDGNMRYELIAGHRRLLAHKYLCEHGDDFEMIEAKIITGDKLTLQLVENLQRSDLSARDREKAIYEMSLIPGVTQREIAAQLSKTEVYISRQISAHKVRQIAEKAGYDTAALETSVMSEIQTAAEKDIPMLIGYIINGGGTHAAARSIMRDYRPPKKTPPEKPINESPQAETKKTGNQTPPPEGAKHEKPAAAPEPDENDIDPLIGQSERGAEIKAENPEAWKRESVPHKQVDLNSVFEEIYNYISGLERKIREAGEAAAPGSIDWYKREAALDIISLVQKRFGE